MDVLNEELIKFWQVPFLHINHLIQNKKVVNRPKDQVDVIELEKIRKLREGNTD